ncbi:MAG: hypothetical protein P4L53_22840 [Candidatus Obscuribacterales bacterium]|nr:hypothetical protein [Candidatus Obscuribacterales bacterium]
MSGTPFENHHVENPKGPFEGAKTAEKPGALDFCAVMAQEIGKAPAALLNQNSVFKDLPQSAGKNGQLDLGNWNPENECGKAAAMAAFKPQDINFNAPHLDEVSKNAPQFQPNWDAGRDAADAKLLQWT